MVVNWRQYLVQQTTSCDIASQCIQGYLEASFKMKCQCWARKETIICVKEGKMSISITIFYHHSTNLSMPNGDPWGRFFYPTHNGFWYYGPVYEIIQYISSISSKCRCNFNFLTMHDKLSIRFMRLMCCSEPRWNMQPVKALVRLCRCTGLPEP